MIHIKKLKTPTREQKKLLAEHKLSPADWLVERDTPEKIVFVHRHSSRTVRTITKE